MNYITILILILLLILIIISIYNSNRSIFAKYIVCEVFSTFKTGNLELIDVKNNSTIFKLINDSSGQIIRVYINNIDKFFTSLYDNQEIGLGESFMNGYWYSNNLFLFLLLLILNQNNQNIPDLSSYNFYNKSLTNDKINIKHHYDVGNDFYLTFLTDKLSAYSCGFFINNNTTLEEAQLNKVNTIIKKLNILPNKTILDIGCGWGKIANYVSEQTKCHVTGITLSDEQIKYAKNNFSDKNVNIIGEDYRNLNKQFDYIYSIGMFEHVRYENYDDFFITIKRCLKPGGRFLLHTIVSTVITNPKQVGKTFVSKYIFPGGQIPNNDWITNSILKNNLNIIHTEFFGGQHYARTLNLWNKNMLAKSDLILSSYNLELLKKYEYYFNVCEACFTAGELGIGHYLITNDITVDVNNNFTYI